MKIAAGGRRRRDMTLQLRLAGSRKRMRPRGCRKRKQGETVLLSGREFHGWLFRVVFLQSSVKWVVEICKWLVLVVFGKHAYALPDDARQIQLTNANGVCWAHSCRCNTNSKIS